MDRQLPSVDGKASGAQTPATEMIDPTLLSDQPCPPEQVPQATSMPAIGGLQFWLIFIALMVTTFLSAIDLVGSISCSYYELFQRLGPCTSR